MPRSSFLLLVAGIICVSVGVWGVRIPLGDEGIYVLQGNKLFANGEYAPNLFFSAYAFLFRYVTEDAVIAHLLIRFFVTAATTLGLYAVLTAAGSFRPLAVVIACLMWASSNYANPFTQDGNVNGFALAMILPGFAALLRWRNVNGLAAFAIGGLLAAQIRPEFYTSLLLVFVCGAHMIRKKFAPDKWTLLLCSIFAALIFWSTTFKADELNPGKYLLQSLGQCYAFFYKKQHPEEVFNPMTEYEPLLNKTFGNPQSFWEAIAHNPIEAVKYFTLNGIDNLSRLIPDTLSSKFPPKTILAALLLIAGTLIGIKNKAPLTNPPTLFVFLALASSSAVAILMLLPDSRYWISCAPLIYLWLAWAADQVLRRPEIDAHKRPILALLLAILCFPQLLIAPAKAAKQSNQEIIVALRDSARELDHPPVIAGNYVMGWAAFAFRGSAAWVGGANGFSAGGIRDRAYDIVIAEGLENSQSWQEERAFLSSFRSDPARYGYGELFVPSGRKTDIYIRLR